jgi:hypothetical protein
VVVVIQLLHLEALGHQHVQVLVAPILRRQVLEEGKGVLVVHRLKLSCELQEER